MQIEIASLKTAADRLFDHLVDGGHETVEIDWDYYWWIPTDQTYDPYTHPTSLTIGQLSDNWSELQRIGAGSTPPVNYAMVWLSCVLRAIGEAVPG